MCDITTRKLTIYTYVKILPAAVIAEGEKLFRNGEYEKALVRYNAVLSEDADNISSLGTAITHLSQLYITIFAFICDNDSKWHDPDVIPV